MQLESLALTNFRNYEKTEIKLSPEINLIYGRNAQGKTNFIEAVYLLCLGRSFRLSSNQELVKYNSDFFDIKGLIRQDNSIDRNVVVHYVRDGRKDISIDRKRIASHSKIFGQFPVVVMAPDEFKVTSGSPAERRRFLDMLLSQASLTYLSDLQEYGRILKQRNKILQQFAENLNVPDSTLEPWTQNLIKYGVSIARLREKFIIDFSIRLNKLYKSLTGSDDELQIEIDSTIAVRIDNNNIDNNNNNEETHTEAFRQAIENKKIKERVIGTTLVGPHRDDLIFKINGHDLRKYGSRGEHKSVLIALKIAEYKYLHERKNETPILLLDDCGSELDESREEGIYHSIQELGQVFMTSPETSFYDRFDMINKRISRFSIHNGTIEYV